MSDEKIYLEVASSFRGHELGNKTKIPTDLDDRERDGGGG